MSLARNYFKKNIGKELNDWLEFDSTFDKPGKQGLVGLLKVKENKDVKMIFKISQTINYLAEHESVILEGLLDISLWCPHYPIYIGNLVTDTNPLNRKSGNPFDITNSRYKIKKTVLLCEYIENSYKLYNYIKAVDKIGNDVIINTIKQVLMALSIAQDKKQFSHYDLHSNNVMMRTCNKDIVMCYYIDENNQFCVPTLGHIPTIIDFGFSYINNMENGPCWPSMGHTEAGYYSDHHDWLLDPKLFLVSVTKELKYKRGKKKDIIKLRNITKNIFKPLNISWSCGWNKGNKQSALDYVSNMIENYAMESKIFYDYLHYSLDLIQSLITLPLKEKPYKGKIHEYYKMFIKEWLKIENQIKSPFYNLYILKKVVDIARKYKHEYLTTKNKSETGLKYKKELLLEIDTIAKFFMSKNINFEIMLCSLYMFSNCIEGVLTDVMLTLKIQDEYNYSKLELNSVNQIFATIDTNFRDNYVFNKNTQVLLMKENTKMFVLEDNEIEMLNNSHPLTRGTLLYEFFQSKNL